MGIISGGQVIPGGRRIRSQSLGSPALGTATAVHAALAVLGSGGPQVVTTGITNPDVPRNITATTAGTNTDVKAVQVTVNGTDINGVTITEDLPVFTVDTNGIVTGSKAFATVTSYSVPAMDGTGATVSIGVGAKLGLPEPLSRDSVDSAYLAGVREGTRPTVAFSSSAVESNTVTLNSALAGTAVVVDYHT
jgi:hypothetical protein